MSLKHISTLLFSALIVCSTGCGEVASTSTDDNAGPLPADVVNASDASDAFTTAETVSPSPDAFPVEPDTEQQDAAGSEVVNDGVEDLDGAADVDVEDPVLTCFSNDDCAGFETGDPCTVGACNPTSNECVAIPAPIGTTCDTDICVVGQVCQAGNCVGGTALNCDDGDPCTVDVCSSISGCTNNEDPNCCIPDCTDKYCGTDGCGGLCGICPEDWFCTDAGVCSDCVPQCIGLTCGDDGCGGTCGVCPTDWECVDPGICMSCVPDCEGKVCGDDGCEGSCGSCGLNKECDFATGQCLECIPDCEGKICGDDGCGGSCGNCGEAAACNDDGQCECVPQCEGKTCGANGCGGSCGDCPIAQACLPGGVCMVMSEGGTCDSPFLVPGVPYDATQNTESGATELYMPSGGCSQEVDTGVASPEHIYAFSPNASDVYTVTVNPITFDAALYVLDECVLPAENCQGFSNEAASEQLVLTLGEDMVYLIVVDGYANIDPAAGLYDISVRQGPPVNCAPSCEGKTCGGDGCGGLCGVCDEGFECQSGVCEVKMPGNTCDDPLLIDTLPFQTQGDSTSFGASYFLGDGACGGAEAGIGNGSSDVVYAFTPAESGNYQLTISAAWDAYVYIASDCADLSESCLGITEGEISLDNKKMVVYLEANTTYFVVVDGNAFASPNLSGVYNLKLAKFETSDCTPSCDGKECGDDACGGFCGNCPSGTMCLAYECVNASPGDTCDAPFMIDDLPFYQAGDTSDATPDYYYGAGECEGVLPGYGVAGSDEVFQFTPSATGAFTFTVQAGFDPTLYIVTDCADITNSCVQAVETGANSEVLSVYLQQGVTYFFVVDYWSNLNNDGGPYALNVEQTCVSNCVGKQCGGDGCGGSCGACLEGEGCLNGYCAPATQGDSCAAPFDINLEAGYFVAEASTAVATDQVNPNGGCPESTLGFAGGDHIYTFFPLETATYLITLTATEPNKDLALYVGTNCEDMGSTCLSVSDTSDGQTSATETLELTLTESQGYSIVVDGWKDQLLYEGDYVLTVLKL